LERFKANFKNEGTSIEVLQRVLLMTPENIHMNSFVYEPILDISGYVIAERFSSADFLHGPIALIEHDFPAFIFMPPGKTFHDMGALAARLRNLRAEVIGITSAKARAAAATRVIRVPGEIPEIYSPIPYIVPGQIFAALLAEIKGLDPDKPRSLNIVTQTV